MSENDNQQKNSPNENNNSSPTSNRNNNARLNPTQSSSPLSANPFLSYLSSSPSNQNSPNFSASPTSPRFQNGMRISNSSIANSMLTAASPPRFASIDQFMTAANAAQNMALAHEISVNQDFKLEKLDNNMTR
jgi:hypothetical protein